MFTDPVTSTETAIAFMRSLHENGLLYHPEESAWSSLDRQGLKFEVLIMIQHNMVRCFAYLDDPCETAIQVSVCCND